MSATTHAVTTEPTNVLTRRIHQRLLPLYIASFAEGVILWYAIERLFMTSIGFNDATVGIMIAAYSAMMIIAETPSGMLADRGSRKRVLLIGFACLALSSFLAGISSSPSLYIGAMLCWAIYSAMLSGTYESVIYDTVLEETGDSKMFSRYYARYSGVDSVAQILGALLGGLAAAFLSLPGIYFVSIPIAIAGFIAVLKFREPNIHKSMIAVPMRAHVLSTLKALRGGGDSTSVLLVLLLQKAVLYVSLFGFAQLWLVALDVPAPFYGPAYAAICATGLIGSYLIKMRIERVAIMSTVLAGVLLACIGLAVLKDPILIVLCQVALGSGLVAVGILFTQYLHDFLDSSVRTGASSALSTLNRCLIIPLSLLIGFISHHESIFLTGWLLAGLVLILSFLVLRTLRHRESVLTLEQ